MSYLCASIQYTVHAVHAAGNQWSKLLLLHGARRHGGGETADEEARRPTVPTVPYYLHLDCIYATSIATTRTAVSSSGSACVMYVHIYLSNSP